MAFGKGRVHITYILLRIGVFWGVGLCNPRAPEPLTMKVTFLLKVEIVKPAT
jgi:hypothetical protein